MCNWITMLYSRKLTEHCKPAITEKNKNHYIKKKTGFEIPAIISKSYINLNKQLHSLGFNNLTSEVRMNDNFQG